MRYSSFQRIAVLGLVLQSLAFTESSKSSSLELGRRQYESGNYERAQDLLSQTVSATSDPNIRNRALYYQGLSFFELGLYYSSYLSFRSVLLNPDERFREVYFREWFSMKVELRDYMYTEQTITPGSQTRTPTFRNNYAIGLAFSFWLPKMPV